MNVVTDNDDLIKFIKIFAREPYIALDTEFMRTKTYYPQLCLIQIACPHTAIVIDPIAGKLDLSLLAELLCNENITKVFHSARQDLEIIYKDLGVIPKPIFDTQIAATICGLGSHASYASLVQQFCEIDLDKSLQFSRWDVRPLDEEAVNYALGDVTHLCTIYEKLNKILKKNARTKWLEEEMSVCYDPQSYVFDETNLYQKLLPYNNGDAMFACLLRKLLIFREDLAKKENKPRGHVISDGKLLELARIKPDNKKVIRKVLGHTKLHQEDFDILEGVIGNITRSEAAGQLDIKPITSYGNKPIIKLYKTLLLKQSMKYNFAEKLIASNEDILTYAINDVQVKFLSGWRKKVYGNYAALLKQGKIALFINTEGEVELMDVATKERS